MQSCLRSPCTWSPAASTDEQTWHLQHSRARSMRPGEGSWGCCTELQPAFAVTPRRACHRTGGDVIVSEAMSPSLLPPGQLIPLLNLGLRGCSSGLWPPRCPAHAPEAPRLQAPPGLWRFLLGSPGVLQAVPMGTLHVPSAEPSVQEAIPPWLLVDNLPRDRLCPGVRSVPSGNPDVCPRRPPRRASHPSRGPLPLPAGTSGSPSPRGARQPGRRRLLCPCGDPAVRRRVPPAPRVRSGAGAQPQTPPSPCPSPGGRQGQRCASS